MASPLREEVLFRGALLGSGPRAMAHVTAVAASSTVFTLWHLRSFADAPDPSESVVVLLVTTVGGLVHGWLRVRSGSVAAPVCLHLATNSGGLPAVAGASTLS